jgi:isopentenyl-diphosphate Delta-isomerase
MINMVLVDKDDNVLGLKEKFVTHKIPVPLHRAISIVIFNRDRREMLIAKRAFTKPTWPGVWSNAVCSHPYPEETYQDAAERRLYEELGIKVPLKDTFNFIYSGEMNNKIWGEHELDHTFVGEYEGKISSDPKEISDYKWIKIADLKKDIEVNPDSYSPWFKIILAKLE